MEEKLLLGLNRHRREEYDSDQAIQKQSTPYSPRKNLSDKSAAMD